jgi:hypothetical protein
LDLDPPYQRRSVWNQTYRDFFVDTVLNSYPCPAIFLHETITPDGVARYSVVDGKQRLKTLFDFANNQFMVADDATITKLRDKYFRDLSDDTKRDFWRYQFSAEFIPQEDEQLINNVFDRINRNVAKLTRQELRHARLTIAASDTLSRTLPYFAAAKSDRASSPSRMKIGARSPSPLVGGSGARTSNHATAGECPYSGVGPWLARTRSAGRIHFSNAACTSVGVSAM